MELLISFLNNVWHHCNKDNIISNTTNMSSFSDSRQATVQRSSGSNFFQVQSNLKLWSQCCNKGRVNTLLAGLVTYWSSWMNHGMEPSQVLVPRENVSAGNTFTEDTPVEHFQWNGCQSVALFYCFIHYFITPLSLPFCNSHPQWLLTVDYAAWSA